MSSSGILLKKREDFLIFSDSIHDVKKYSSRDASYGMVFSNDPRGPRFLQGGVLWLEHRAAHLNSQCGSHGSAPEAALRAALVD